MKSLDVEVPSQHGRTAVITGTGGLGLHAARKLAGAGAKVILAGRNPEKGADAVRQVKTDVPGAIISFEPMDLASLQSVAKFADRLLARGEMIDMLINNAGIMSPPQRSATVDGFELQFGVNYLGHFALTARLMPLLRGGAPRVVTVTSLAHRHARLDFDDLQNERRYNTGLAYCQSKLAMALFAIELQRRSKAGGWRVQSMAAHPGFAATNLFENGQGPKSILNFVSTRIVIPLIGQSGSAGALPIIHAATSPDAIGGNLYGPRGFMEMSGLPGTCNFAKHANDPAIAARLWSVSEQLTGLTIARDVVAV